MKFSFPYLFESDQPRQHEISPVVVLDESLHNITEGGEFLDDAIRMKEQPLMYHGPGDKLGSETQEDRW